MKIRSLQPFSLRFHRQSPGHVLRGAPAHVAEFFQGNRQQIFAIFRAKHHDAYTRRIHIFDYNLKYLLFRNLLRKKLMSYFQNINLKHQLNRLKSSYFFAFLLYFDHEIARLCIVKVLIFYNFSDYLCHLFAHHICKVRKSHSD